MKKMFSAYFVLFLAVNCCAQPVNERLNKAWQKFVTDSQMRAGIASLYVIDARSGEVIFDANSSIGLAPASTQKIITSVTAFELLGKDFRYQTQLGLEKADGKTILHIYGNGDPTFGSWRWDNTNEHAVLRRWVQAVREAGVDKISHVYSPAWESETIPDGWIWQDIGNYYGAGASAFNWRENQYDIFLCSGNNIGDNVSVVKTVPKLHGIELESVLKAAGKNTGDNAYVYYPLNERSAIIRGTIPSGENNFKISASFPSGIRQFLRTLSDTLKRLDIKVPSEISSAVPVLTDSRDIRVIHNHDSPPLDSIIYWFNKKSINLYGEALIKTIAVKQTGIASTDTGTSLIRKFWKEKGIHPDELNMYDGSGLSPLNRVTTHAQAEILRFAKTRDWFPEFYNALPDYNGMRMKSGTISDVKGFCGYHTSKEGKEYIFSILVNNYGGRTGSMVSKMYSVLDELK